MSLEHANKMAKSTELIHDQTSINRDITFHVDEHSGKLKKDLGWMGILAAAYNVSNSWLVIAATMVISVGFGPMNTIWGVILITSIYACIGLSLAELVSAYPTVGGQYHWTSILAPAGMRNMLSYCCGFLNWFAWLTMSASSSGAVPACVFALVIHANPIFTPQNWQTFLIYQAVVLFSFIFNLLGKKGIKHFYSMGFALSLVAFLVFTVTILAMQPSKQTSATIWTSHTEVSGWSSGVQFLIALSAPAVAFCPIDGAVHLVEEVKNAPRIVPYTMLLSLVISFVTSLAFTLASLYCVSDFDALFSTPSHFPLYEIWSQATSTSTVPLVFTIATMLLLPVGSVACFQVSSMLTLSLGRDRCLVFSRHLAKINTTLNTPVWACIMNWLILTAMGCLFLFSTFAFNSLVGAAVILQQATVFLCISLLLYHRRSEQVLPASRPFRLPNWLGYLVNIVSVAFTVITSTFFMFPSSTSVEDDTMNYAVVVSLGSLAVGLVNYFVYARGRYSGPTLIELHY